MISDATRIARSKAYKDLTYEEKIVTQNGCGAKHGIKVPDFCFREACNRHDYDYYTGGTNEDRIVADKRFLK